MEKTTKKQLLDAVHSAWAEWESILGQVAEERMTEKGATGEWSVKDVIAHVKAWEERAVAKLESAQSGQRLKPADWPSDMDESQTNDWIFKKYRDRPLRDVVEESARVHRRLVDLIAALPEKDLIEPDRIEGLDGSRLIDEIPGDSYEHYRNHAEVVRSWLKKARD